MRLRFQDCTEKLYLLSFQNVPENYAVRYVNYCDLLQALQLPTSYRAGAFPGLLDAMRVDKKARGTMLRLVVLDGLARPAVVSDPDLAVLSAAYDLVSD